MNSKGSEREEYPTCIKFRDAAQNVAWTVDTSVAMDRNLPHWDIVKIYRHRYAPSLTRIAVSLAVVAAVAASALGGPITAPDLGTAINFGLLADTISSTGTSIVNGNVGAITSITGFPPATATGSVTLAGPVVTAAFNDFVSAFNFALSDTNTPPTQTVTGGLTQSQTFLGNNVYSFSSTDNTSVAGITLNFDAQGNSSDIFILKDIASLTIDGPIAFTLTGGALARNIYWIITDSATINPSGVPITFDGNILAGSSFSMFAQAGGSSVLAGTINGCVYTDAGNSTMAGTTIITGCGASATANTPEPGSAVLIAIGGLLAIFLSRLRTLRPLNAISEN